MAEAIHLIFALAINDYPLTRDEDIEGFEGRGERVQRGLIGGVELKVV